MKIGIIGAGGVGAYFAAALTGAGHEVHILATPRHVRPLTEQGLRLTTGGGQDTTVALAGVAVTAESIGECEAVILACKAGQAYSVMAAAGPLLGPNTPVLPLQNGVTAIEQITRAVGPGHALGGVCMIISYLVEPGHVHHVGGQPAVTLGEPDGADTSRTHGLKAALDSAGITTRVSGDIITDVWRKFMLITSYGGVGALCGRPVGEIRDHPQTRSLVQDAMGEVAAIGKAAGAHLTEADIRITMSQYDAFTPDSTASMQRDLAAGRASELEEQNGTVARLAVQHGIPAPIHTTIYRALSIRDKG